MTVYHFRLVLDGPFSAELTDDELLDATDALGAVGCDDAAISVHAHGLELEFDRSHQTLQDAIASAVTDAERAGFHVKAIEMERDAVIPLSA